MVFWLIVPAMLDCLNLFWFRKMIIGALKAMKKPDTEEDSDIKSKVDEVRKRDKVKQFVKTKYINFKSIIMRRKPEVIGKRSD